MSGSISDFSLEILLKIFSYLDTSDLLHCSLVSWRFYEAVLVMPMTGNLVYKPRKCSLASFQSIMPSLRKVMHLEFSPCLLEPDTSMNKWYLLRCRDICSLDVSGKDISIRMFSNLMNHCRPYNLNLSNCRSLFLSGDTSFITKDLFGAVADLDISDNTYISNITFCKLAESLSVVRSLNVSNLNFLVHTSDAYTFSPDSRNKLDIEMLIRLIESQASTLENLNLSGISNVSSACLRQLLSIPNLKIRSLQLSMFTDDLVPFLQPHPLQSLSIDAQKVHDLTLLDVPLLVLDGAKPDLLFPEHNLLHLNMNSSTIDVLPPNLLSFSFKNSKCLLYDCYFSMLGHQLTSLELEDCEIKPNAFNVIFSMSRLCTLKMSKLFLTDHILLGNYSDCRVRPMCTSSHFSPFALTPSISWSFKQQPSNLSAEAARTLAAAGKGLQQLKNLRHLVISSNIYVTDKSLSQALVLPSLTSLDISFCAAVTNVTFLSLLHQLPRLERLFVSPCQLAILDVHLFREQWIKVIAHQV